MLSSKNILGSNLIISLIILATTLAAFNSCLYAGFLLVDDDINIYKNPLFSQISAATFIKLWEGPYENLYIPLTYTLWAMIYEISCFFTGTPQPIFFHTTNVICHSLNSILVFTVLAKIIKGINGVSSENIKIYAIVGAIFFSIHPIQVEAVAWISSFKDTFSTFFCLLSTYLFIISETDDHQKHKTIKKGCALLFFVAGILSKPSTVVLPILIALIMLRLLNKSVKSLYHLLPWLIVSFLAIVASKAFMPLPPKENILHLWQRPFLAFDVLFFYLKKFFWPNTLINDYGRAPKLLFEQSYIYFQPLIAAIAVLFFRNLKCTSLFLEMIIAFFITILPYCGIVQFEFQRISTVADRYAYLGLFVIILYLIIFIVKTKISVKYFSSISLLLVVLLFLQTTIQTKVWQNNITLSEHTLKFNPKSELSLINMGIEKTSRGLFNEAIEHYEKAIVLNPNNELAFYNLGVALATIGKKNEALNQVKKLEVFQPSKANQLNYIIKKIDEIRQKNFDENIMETP